MHYFVEYNSIHDMISFRDFNLMALTRNAYACK